MHCIAIRNCQFEVKINKDNENESIQVSVNKNSDKKISLLDVEQSLTNHGIDFKEYNVQYHNKENNSYNSFPKDINENYLIPFDMVEKGLEVKCEKIDSIKKIKHRTKVKRTQERKICDVVEKVTEWRQLHMGDFPGKNGQKHTLEEAASIIGLPKKTLDDYLLQIQAGRKYGFDFVYNSEQKIGLLRNYIKEYKRNHDISN